MDDSTSPVENEILNDLTNYLTDYLAGACDSRRLWLVILLILPASTAGVIDYVFILICNSPDTPKPDILDFIPGLLIVNIVVVGYLLCWWEETFSFLLFVILLPIWIVFQCYTGLLILLRILYSKLSSFAVTAFDITLRCVLYPLRLVSLSGIVRTPRYRKKLQFECAPGCMSHRGKLCATCENLIDSSRLLTGTRAIFSRPAEVHLHHTKIQLQISAKSCHLCNLLLHSVRVNSDDGFAESLATEYGSVETIPQNWIKVKIWKEVSPYLVHSKKIQLCGPGIVSSMPLRIEEIATSLTEECDITNDTGSQGTLVAAMGWMDSCRSHGSCGRLESQFRPTRLLEIKKTSLLENEVKLVETSELPLPVGLSYVALSHCWGGSIDFKLMEANREAMMLGIDVSFLERNFQDAVTITSGLGQKYLWIDSLCILQDSKSDWEYESARMGLLYVNSVCTISATASKNSKGGCILPKNIFLGDCVLRKEIDCQLLIRSWTAAESSLDYLFSQKVDGAALSKRAWIFQERILSRSVLNFCDGILLFECNTMRASEYHPAGVRYREKETVQRDGSRNLGPRKIVRPARERGQKYVTNSTNYRRKGKPGFKRGFHGTESYTVRNPAYYYEPEQITVIVKESAILGIRGAFDMLSQVRHPVVEDFQRLEIHRRWFELVSIYSSRQLTMKKDKLMAISGIVDGIQRSTSRLTFLAGMWKQAMLYNLLWVARNPISRSAPREVPTWSWASVDGVVDEIIYEASKEHRESLDLVLDINDVHPMVTQNSVIHHAHLAVSGYVIALDERRINFLPDTSSDESSKSEIAYIPIVLFRNGLRKLEVHGIVVREDVQQAATFERVGYFWTNDVSATADILGKVTESDLKKVLKLT